jgi:DNA polymerase I-like protein with 3'-5' exonuclease and polymerase domains
MVLIEFCSGEQRVFWRDQLLALRQAPFDVGDDALFVCFQAVAELSVMLELGWTLPRHTLDLYAEHRVQTNGTNPIYGNNLIGALALRGLSHIDVGEKEEMRKLITSRRVWTDSEIQSILDYCRKDVVALIALLPVMAPCISLPLALLRGRYGGAVARMEREGIPIDVELYRVFQENWGALRPQLIREADTAGVYEGESFRMLRFANYLVAKRIINGWPRTPTGLLATDDDTFLEQIELHRHQPFAVDLKKLRELGATLHRLRNLALKIGSDGRSRAQIKPFWTITSRNGPEASEFIFGPARWMRGFIRPAPGWGLAYIDWASQEIAIAASSSGDELLAQAYASGDPYWWFATTTGLAPSGALASDHKGLRSICKVLFLATNYGAGAGRIAAQAGISVADAKRLLRLHRQTFSAFWRWSEQTVDRALLGGKLRTPFGWEVRGRTGANAPDLMNWPMQSSGADQMRIAAVAATEAGLVVHTPIHDAFLIGAPLERLDRDVALMEEIMRMAGKSVTSGLTLRTEKTVVRSPGRYMDDRGKELWHVVMGLLKRRGVRAAA